MNEQPARERILAATRELLRQSEGEIVTVGRVAAAAHVSRATLYRYFPDRVALLRAAGVEPGAITSATEPRVRILEAALDEFAERGVHKATLADVASRAGLSLSGLHWHYKNKDELVADLIQYIPLLPTLTEAVQDAAGTGADLEEQLTRLATVILGILERRGPLLRFILFEAAVYPEVARLAQTHTIGRVLPMLVRLFEAHARNGTLRPGSAQARAQAFLGMFLVLGVLRPTFAALLAPDDRATAREYVQIMLRGIVAEGKGGS
jgi:AcrR family transcriptional regulator